MKSALLACYALCVSACDGSISQPAKHGGMPKRIVSMNPCVDGILERVVAPERIAGISHYSMDPRATSVSLKWAQQFVATDGSAESVIARRPDLVITGTHIAPATRAVLRRLNIPVLEVAVPNSIRQSMDQIRAIANATGFQNRGTALIAEIDAAMRHANAHTHTAPAPSALVRVGGGLVPGENTLADDMLRQSGFRNASGSMGLQQWDVLSIERLLADPPDMLLMPTDDLKSDRQLSHPALAHAREAMVVSHFPARLLNCGGPTIISALNSLANARKRLHGAQR